MNLYWLRPGGFIIKPAVVDLVAGIIRMGYKIFVACRAQHEPHPGKMLSLGGRLKKMSQRLNPPSIVSINFP
jgi:hypothetical protein